MADEGRSADEAIVAFLELHPGAKLQDIATRLAEEGLDPTLADAALLIPGITREHTAPPPNVEEDERKKWIGENARFYYSRERASVAAFTLVPETAISFLGGEWTPGSPGRLCMRLARRNTDGFIEERRVAFLPKDLLSPSKLRASIMGIFGVFVPPISANDWNEFMECVMGSAQRLQSEDLDDEDVLRERFVEYARRLNMAEDKESLALGGYWPDGEGAIIIPAREIETFIQFQKGEITHRKLAEALEPLRIGSAKTITLWISQNGSKARHDYRVWRLNNRIIGLDTTPKIDAITENGGDGGRE